MWNELIDVFTKLVGGTPSAEITTMGLILYTTIVVGVATAVVYKLGYEAANSGQEPNGIMGILVKK